MNNRADTTRSALRRMLSNGRLTALPKSPSDQALLAALAVARLDAGRDYVERDVNDALVAWLGTVSEPYGIDHVTLRRLLVDSRLLTRTASGSTYHVNAAKLSEIDAVRDVDPARVLADLQAERETRKRSSARAGTSATS
jgi:hypothetical protein